MTLAAVQRELETLRNEPALMQAHGVGANARTGTPGLQQRIDELAELVGQIRLVTPSGSTAGGARHGGGGMRARPPKI